MGALRRFVVLVLLGVWCFPALSLAKPLPAPAAASSPSATPRGAPQGSGTTTGEAASLGERERKAQDLEGFRGGGVYIYMGSGALLVLVIVLLIILI